MFRRRSSRKPLQGYVSPPTIARLLRQGKYGIKPPEVKHFQFVLALADDTNPQDVPATLSNIVGTLLLHQSTVMEITCSLVVGVLGVPFLEGNSAEARRALVAALLQENGDRIRIAHGECNALVGMFGGSIRSTYGAMIPAFSEILKKLLAAPLGTALEIP